MSTVAFVFEWLPGEQFLVERWQVLIPEAPDGIAIIGAGPGRISSTWQICHNGSSTWEYDFTLSYNKL